MAAGVGSLIGISGMVGEIASVGAMRIDSSEYGLLGILLSSNNCVTLICARPAPADPDRIIALFTCEPLWDDREYLLSCVIVQ